mgnify:CR=1 FL=1
MLPILSVVIRMTFISIWTYHPFAKFAEKFEKQITFWYCTSNFTLGFLFPIWIRFSLYFLQLYLSSSKAVASILLMYPLKANRRHPRQLHWTDKQTEEHDDHRDIVRDKDRGKRCVHDPGRGGGDDPKRAHPAGRKSRRQGQLFPRRGLLKSRCRHCGHTPGNIWACWYGHACLSTVTRRIRFISCRCNSFHILAFGGGGRTDACFDQKQIH